MTRISARYYDGQSSAAKTVEVVILDAIQLEIRDQTDTKSYTVNACIFEAPLGNTRRVILLPDNGRLETDDFEAYDALQDSLNPGMGLKWAHWLERKWGWVIASMSGLVAFTAALFTWGVPWAAFIVAHKIPVELNDQLGKGALETMDRFIFEPSEISTKDQERYQNWFEEIADDFKSEHTYTLFFRATELGANAFALPNGSIVATDALVALVSGKEEFQAVIAHEIAHIIHRHSMQMVLRDTGIFIFISTFLGDLASLSSMASAIPTILIENSYSRGFETEADLVSGQWLQEKYGSSEAMRSILIKIHEENEGADLPELMSTHPDLKNRIMLLEETFPLPQESEER
ncbi:MAG: M48 family metallopeptidase [Verrucomicrobia bacterium]|nr:M48 family metallopeptidase [Verrucomicrobiota bacterium]MDA1067755.1 M48 family metallopeptidase [Verrucomicrobiota bacterium]